MPESPPLGLDCRSRLPASTHTSTHRLPTPAMVFEKQAPAQNPPWPRVSQPSPKLASGLPGRDSPPSSLSHPIRPLQVSPPWGLALAFPSACNALPPMWTWLTHSFYRGLNSHSTFSGTRPFPITHLKTQATPKPLYPASSTPSGPANYPARIICIPFFRISGYPTGCKGHSQDTETIQQEGETKS